MRIPAAGDHPAPLVVPHRSRSGDGSAEGSGQIGHVRRKRKRKSRKSEETSWDADSKGSSHRSGRREKRQMFWMLVGGSTLLAGILVVIFIAAFQDHTPPPAPVAESKVKTQPDTEMTNLQPVLSDAAFLAMAEPMAKRFLEASRVDDLLPLVRNPEESGRRISEYYSEGNVKAVGMSKFNSLNEIIRDENSYMVAVSTREFEEKVLAFVNTPDGLRIDWESWVGWSEMGWDQFMETKPTVPKLFRVNLAKLEYYNMAFADDSKWQSYHLLSPDGIHALYGYSERGSVISSQLHVPPESTSATYTLMLRFPEGGTSRDQVIIDQVVAEGWVLGKATTQ
jgi:hypothetical protein